MTFVQARLENAIAFFAKEFHKRTGKYLPQTGLYKFLSLLDFKILKMNGKPAFDLKYKAMEHGPVPEEIYNNRDTIKSVLFYFKKISEKEYIIITKGKIDLDYFSDEELKIMDDLLFTFAQREYGTTKIMSDESHKKIKAWEKAWNTARYSEMKYSDEFDDIYKKTDDRLTPEEDRFLIYESFKKMRAAH